MKYTFLQSGSSGNSLLLQTKKTNILIDVGLYYSTIEERLNKLKIKVEDIDAILITHEHIDHIKAIRYFKDKNIYATKETLINEIGSFSEILPYKKFIFKDLIITPVSTSHDVSNPVGYIIESNDEKLIYITDTGTMPLKTKKYLYDADYIIMEANYNVDMLNYSSRPIFLKKRIASNKGHLSTIQCGEILKDIISDKTKYITLAHVSGDCNNPTTCLNDVKNILKENNIDISNIKINVASRDKITKGN